MLFEKNFEKKFETATKAFTKAVIDLDDITKEVDEELDQIANKLLELNEKKSSIIDTRNKVLRVSDKLKEIFGDN